MPFSVHDSLNHPSYWPQVYVGVLVCFLTLVTCQTRLGLRPHCFTVPTRHPQPQIDYCLYFLTYS